MTFHALYWLEARNLLACPIVGVAVDEWTDDELRHRARHAIEATGEPVDPAMFDRLAARLSYVQGEYELRGHRGASFTFRVESQWVPPGGIGGGLKCHEMGGMVPVYWPPS